MNETYKNTMNETYKKIFLVMLTVEDTCEATSRYVYKQKAFEEYEKAKKCFCDLRDLARAEMLAEDEKSCVEITSPEYPDIKDEEFVLYSEKMHTQMEVSLSEVPFYPAQ